MRSKARSSELETDETNSQRRQCRTSRQMRVKGWSGKVEEKRRDDLTGEQRDRDSDESKNDGEERPDR